MCLAHPAKPHDDSSYSRDAICPRAVFHIPGVAGIFLGAFMLKPSVDTEIRVRITDDEYRFIRDEAKSTLRSESNFVRYLIHKQMMASDTLKTTPTVRHLS